MKKIFKTFMIVFIMLLSVIFLESCGENDIKVELVSNSFHEGDELPQLNVSDSSISAKWLNDEKLKAGIVKYKYYLSNDSSVILEIEITATAHSALAYETIKEPTCSDDGIKAKKCIICDIYYDYQSISAHGHSYTKQYHTDGNCYEYGYTIYRCDICDDLKQDTNGSTFKTIDTNYGDHIWEVDEDKNFVISEEVQEVSCSDEGKGFVYCINHEHCNGKHLVVSDILDHDYSDDEYIAGENCLEHGYTMYKCVMCGRYEEDIEGNIVKDYDLDYGDHDYTKEDHITGSCYEYGYIEYHCQVCDSLYVDLNNEPIRTYDIKYENHIWEVDEDDNYIIANVITAATCERDGLGHVYCIYHDECGGTKDVKIDQIDHEYTVKVHTNGSDCEHTGYDEFKCTFSCNTYKLDLNDDHYKEYDEVYGSHNYVSGTCSICGGKVPADATYNVGTNADKTSVVAKIYQIGSTGTYDMIISGEGTMTDYTSSSTMPWYQVLNGQRVLNRIKTVTVEDGVTSFSNYGFYGSTSLESIILADSVTIIGSNAFYGCTALTSIDFSEGLLTIGQSAFNGCSRLSIDSSFPASLATISATAFNGCLMLKKVDLSLCSGVNIVSNAFYAIDIDYVIMHASAKRVSSSFGGRGTVIYYEGSYPASGFVYESSSIIYCLGAGNKFADMVSIENGTHIIKGAKDLVYVSAYNAFRYSGQTNLGLGSGTSTAIKRQISGDIITLAKKNITNTEYNTLINNLNLTMIGDYAFNYCSALTSITLPDTCKYVGNWAFANTSAMTSFTVNTDSNLEVFGEYAFALSKITSLYIPQNTKYVGAMLFYNSTALTDLYYDAKEAYRYGVEANATKGKFGSTGSSTTYYSIVTAANGCNITLHIGSNVQKITEGAFAGHSKITTNTGIVSIDFSKASSLIEIQMDAFNHTTNTKFDYLDISGAKNLTTIGDYAFYNCPSIKTIILPGFSKIGMSSFVNHAVLENVYITGNINLTISNSAYSLFYGSGISTTSKIINIHILDEVTSLPAMLLYVNAASNYNIILSENNTLIEAQILALNNNTAGLTYERIETVTLPN